MIEYKIYGLKDPIDNIIKYVGVSKNIESRYKQHLYSKIGKKSEWITELNRLDLRPEIIILDIITTSDRNVALNKEKEYIIKYKNTSYNICNTEDNKKNHTLISVNNITKKQLDDIRSIYNYSSYDKLISTFIVDFYKNKAK